MRITLFAHGLRGDVWPIVALGWHLAARDHDVTVAVPDEFREFTERAGLPTAPLPFDLMAWLSTTDGQRMLQAGGVRLMRGVAQEYRRHADAFDEAYEAAAQGAEALVGTFLTWDRALALGDLLRIPLATVYLQPYAPSGEYSSVVSMKEAGLSSGFCVQFAGWSFCFGVSSGGLGVPARRGECAPVSAGG